MIRFFSIIFFILAVGLGYWHIIQQPAWAPFDVPVSISADNPTSATAIENTFIPSTPEREVHAASLIALNDGNVRAFWFAGSREGAEDVVIRSAVFDTQSHTWETPTIVTDRLNIEKGLLRYIAKVGNPVPIRTSDGHIHLLFVTVSIGGWATSSISALTSIDEGNTWQHPQRLITSPFGNLSTLVKSPALAFNDGRLGLPVYHEFLGKFGELLRLEPAGGKLQVINKRRMSNDFQSLQPIIFVDTPTKAIAYFRQARLDTATQRIPTSLTETAGYHWDMSNDLPLPNPNAALAGLTLPSGDRLLIWNDLEKERYRLVMAISRATYLEGHLHYSDWKIIHTFEDDSALPVKDRRKYAYPYAILDHAGNVHVVYTWKQKKIKHVQFSSAYLEKSYE